MADACRCDYCCPSSPAQKSTRAYMRECEVRHLARLPSHNARAEVLIKIQRARGAAAAQQLRVDVWAYMRANA